MKNYKKLTVAFLAAALLCSATACDSAQTQESSAAAQPGTLVAYFSISGNTRQVAETIASLTGGELFEIEAANPYTDEDLSYDDEQCRSKLEQNDDAARPEISGTVEDMDEYDIIFIGYPIWMGNEPRIIDTFVESYDLSGKTVVNFCTSDETGIEDSTSRLKSLLPDSNWLNGQRFEVGADEQTVQDWLDGLNILKTEVS